MEKESKCETKGGSDENQTHPGGLIPDSDVAAATVPLSSPLSYPSITREDCKRFMDALYEDTGGSLWDFFTSGATNPYPPVEYEPWDVSGAFPADIYFSVNRGC